ncbi:MAG: hypothetical protein AB7L91_18935 [Dehalococcoidia bacterium]
MCCSGNPNDQAILPEIHDGLRGWRLGRVFTVVDRGFSSRENVAYLQRAGQNYIAGERMRDGGPHAAEALSRQGRYQQVRDNLRVKEVRLDSTPGVRWITCHNLDQAERDAAARSREQARTRRASSANAMTATARRRAERQPSGTRPRTSRPSARCASAQPSGADWTSPRPGGSS